MKYFSRKFSINLLKMNYNFLIFNNINNDIEKKQN